MFMTREKRRIPRTILLVLTLALVVIAGVGAFRAGPAPEIKITPGFRAIGKRTPVKIEIVEPQRGLSRVTVDFVQDQRVEGLAEKNYTPLPPLIFWGPRTQRDEIAVEVGRDTIANLKTGQASVRVTAGRAGSWWRSPAPVIQEVSLPVWLTPPSLQVTSIQTYAAQGGCEAVAYRVGESCVRDGVRSGGRWFPGFPLPGGGKQDRFALFAVPYDSNDSKVRLVADDGAGNEAEVAFIEKFFPKPVKTDTIQVTDEFMAKVVPEILSHTTELADRGSLLNNYLAINRELRQKNAEELNELAKKSRPQFLWSKPFLPLGNAQVMSSFADRRTYFHGGKEIDRQDHLGFDLAVTRRTQVPAANDGMVVLAKYFGIYGNAVVIDHGYGLMSLYGHLSSIAVAPGQQVSRSDVLGQTGETGLAGGDHLHFTTLLQGLPVNPVEWWDSHWIQDRIARKLGPAFPYKSETSPRASTK
jgi:murein DD-endopeptidase MepM/ murein hydrolase activator NlpD